MKGSERNTLGKSWQKAFQRTAIVLAVGGAFGHGTVAMAQSSTVGTVFGQVAAGAGDTVTIKNTATGLTRTVGVDANGAFRFSALPPGRYTATLLKGSSQTSTVELELLGGQGAEASFVSSKGATELEKVVVTGRAKSIDVSSTTNGSVFSAKQLDALPIANQGINGIVLLSQNTVSSDSRYAGGVSIGGGAPSENSYYINGFPVTNPLTQLGSLELPYYAISQAQVQTGGFGAEFGRSVGGVVNIITKSGTNKWTGGGRVSWAPDALRANPANLYYADTGANPSTDGTIFNYRKKDERDEKIYSLFAGGPIVKDKLFVFGSVDLTNLNRERVNATPTSSNLASTGFRDSDNENLRYLGKVDYYITDNNRLEGTVIGDNYKTDDDFYGYNYATNSRTNYSYSESSKNLGSTTTGVGGDAQLLRYVGTFIEDLTVTALYGQSQFKHKDDYSFDVNTAPEILFGTGTSSIDPRVNNPNPTVANRLPGGTSIIPVGAKETTKSYRLDAEYKLGNHLLRAGVDENRLKSKNAGDAIPPAGYFRYFRTTNVNFRPAGPGHRSLAEAGASPQPNGGNAPNQNNYYYVRSSVFNDVTDAESNQSAQYIEDRWNITKDVLFTFGLRNESFENLNGDGETFLKSDDFVSPRFSASWDVNGDASLKIFGSAGRYSLQIPTRVAVRGASRSTNTQEFFLYSGVDPATGAPTGLNTLGPAFSANNEVGQRKDPGAVADQDIDTTYQDEVTLGFEKTLLPTLNGGLKVTFRKLERSIDDFCDARPVQAYADANGIDLSQADVYPFGCATINPGQDVTLFLDPDGADDDGNGVDEKPQRFDLKAGNIGLDKSSRTYLAFDVFLEHPLRNKWYGKVTYTWSKSKGNTEGQTRSDTAQTDVAVTQTADFPELGEFIYGDLPNDRRHQFKAYGYYQVLPELTAGVNLLVESGRPQNCIGNYGGTGEDPGYGSAFQYCNFDGVTSVPTPRGSQGRLPWNYSLDLNAVYKPAFAKGVSLRADVFNVFDNQQIQTVDEVHEVANDSTSILPTYGRTISFTAPRTVRFTAAYEF